MSTPLRRLRPGRGPETDESKRPDQRAVPEQLTNPVPVSGLVGPQPTAGSDSTVIRRMRFYRAQLTDSKNLNGIAAVAKQTGIIDTSKLTPQDRINLMLILKVDKDFRAHHVPLLEELADEIRADHGPRVPTTAVPDAPKESTSGAKPGASVPPTGALATTGRTPATDRPAVSAATPQSRPEPTPMQYASIDVTDISGTFASQTEADAKWKVRSQTSGVTSREVIGTYSDETRLSLDYALYRCTIEGRLGTELRLLVPIRLGAASPTVPVLMRWDPAGVATVRLVGEKGPKPPTTPDKAVLAEYLGTKGVTVADLGAWTASQLREFVVAVKLIDSLDSNAVRALEGIVLEYTTKADTSSRKPQEASFAWHPQNKTKPTFLVRQQAYREDATQFVGSEPGQLRCRSTMTIAHELGHAVEDVLYRRLSGAQSDAVNAQADAYERYRVAKNNYQDATQDANAAIGESYQTAAEERKSALANALADLYEVAEKAINAVITRFDAVTDRGQLSTLPKSDIEAAKVAVTQAPVLVAAVVKKNMAAALPYKPLLNALVAGRDRLLLVLDGLNSAAETARTMNANLEKVVYRPTKTQVRSKRLQNFIEFVGELDPQSQQRVVGITLYAKQQWPHNPRELFAEAYALWLTDKPFLTSTAPEFVAYFAKGMHLK